MLIDIKAIAGMLADRIDTLVPCLLPAAVRRGAEWVVGGLDGARGESLSVNRGARRGVWKDFAADVGGDALSLVAEVLFAGDLRKAVAWSKSWLGLDTLAPDRLHQLRQAAKERAEDIDAAAIKAAERKSKLAAEIWDASSPDLVGSPVDAYLRGRAIDLARLPALPLALRFHPGLAYRDRATGEVSVFPAMVAGIATAHGKPAIHRTFLARGLGGTWGKAPVPCPKLTLGSWAGGFIPISKGGSGCSMLSAPPGEPVMLAEGIEDALSLALLYPERRVLATISIGNLGQITLPPAVSTVYLAVDNDYGNPAAARCVQAAIRRYADAAAGREVLVMRSPLGKDFNDLLRTMAGMWARAGRHTGENHG